MDEALHLRRRLGAPVAELAAFPAQDLHRRDPDRGAQRAARASAEADAAGEPRRHRLVQPGGAHPLRQPSRAIRRGRRRRRRFAGEAGAKIFTLAFFVIAARLLGAREFGLYSYAVSFVTLFVLFSDLGLNTLLTREIARDSTRAPGYVGNIGGLKLCLLGAAFLACLAAALRVALVPGRSEGAFGRMPS